MVTNSQKEDLIFKALVDSTRRDILRQLSQQPQAVNEIANHYPMSRPAISKHLRILKEAELIKANSQGRTTIYHLKTSTLRDIEVWLNDLWQSRLIGLKNLIEGANNHD